MGNVALNKQATASSYVLPFDPSKAVDGNVVPLKRWVSNLIPAWLQVDLGKTTFINRWVVKNPGAAGFQTNSYNMNTYKLQGSNDGVTWGDIDGVTGNTQNATDRTCATVGYRYFRVYVSNGLNANKGLAAIADLELYEAPNPYLKTLTLSTGTLSPAFTSTVFSYTAAVPYETTSITVTPTADDPSATIKVNGTACTSGQPSGPISLNEGSNTVTIEVTAASGLKQSYTVAVTRASSPYLTGITFSTGSLGGSFDKQTLAYNANIPYDGASITITPTAEDSTAGITVNGVAVTSGQPSGAISLNVGVNAVITIVVTSKIGVDSRTYTITPTRASSPYLLGLTVKKGMTNFTLSPTFSRGTTLYTLSVANGTTSVTVTATAEEASATIQVNNTSTPNGQGVSVPIVVGLNPVNVVVTAGTGVDSKTYTINITRNS